MNGTGGSRDWVWRPSIDGSFFSIPKLPKLCFLTSSRLPPALFATRLSRALVLFTTRDIPYAHFARRMHMAYRHFACAWYREDGLVTLCTRASSTRASTTQFDACEATLCTTHVVQHCATLRYLVRGKVTECFIL